MTDDTDAETLAFAHRMFDLAHGGMTEELAGQVDAGLPVNLGSPSAVDIARFFDLPEMLAALGRT
ncbi:hypothetical protein GCM10023176_50210 [Micromonospora coerulea]|uniref:Uncharacterized protein n=1 Tax=Micromonospora coerulea TaxID=47856 RepID=A0ABP8SWX5_9ACTN